MASQLTRRERGNYEREWRQYDKGAWPRYGGLDVRAGAQGISGYPTGGRGQNYRWGKESRRIGGATPRAGQVAGYSGRNVPLCGAVSAPAGKPESGRRLLPDRIALCLASGGLDGGGGT